MPPMSRRSNRGRGLDFYTLERSAGLTPLSCRFRQNPRWIEKSVKPLDAWEMDVEIYWMGFVDGDFMALPPRRWKATP